MWNELSIYRWVKGLKLLKLGPFLVAASMLHAETSKATDPPPSNSSCGTAIRLCDELVYQSFDDRDYMGHCLNVPLVLWFYFYSTQTQTVDIAFTPGVNVVAYAAYGPFSSGPICSSVSFDEGDLASCWNAVTLPTTQGWYALAVEVDECFGTLGTEVSSGELSCSETICGNCIPSFAPLHGESYLLNAWCLDDDEGDLVINYTDPHIYVDFGPTPSTVGPFVPAGPIIDGWQRIEGEFVVPLGAEYIKIRLQADDGEVLFDDIRVFPTDGSLKCFVYDSRQQRLVAELDERHFATLYEYDAEGQLVRIKKETERGVMTVQEQRANSSKLSIP